MEAVVAIDQGTSSTRALAFDLNGQCLHMSQQPINTDYPQDGCVEQDPQEIYQKTLAVVEQVIEKLLVENYEVISVGITNQRETTVVWQRQIGRAIYPAILWQDRRTQKV